MEIRRVPVGQLNPAAYNPRRDLRPGDAAYQKLARSLDRFGCVEPIVWNERTGNVVGGHQRLKVLLALGAAELDVSVVNLSDGDEKALNIALNKIEGEWDPAALDALLRELAEASSVDETLTGFDPGEFDRLLAELDSRIQAPTPAVVAPYVDSFFESGVQTAPPKPPQPVEAAPVQEQGPTLEAPRSSVVVYGLTPGQLEALTAFLTENGFSYRLEAGGP